MSRKATQRRLSHKLKFEMLENREVPAALSLVPPGAGTNGDTQVSVVSGTGRYVAFETTSTNVIAGTTDGNAALSDVYLYDRVAATTTLVSRSAASATATADAASFSPRISSDGRYVVFESNATNLVTGQVDTNADADVFLFDRTTSTVKLVSRAAGTVATTGNNVSYGNGGPGAAVISANGSTIAFTSFATNLITGLTDANATSDVFTYDVAAGTLALVSRSSALATVTAMDVSENPTISSDGSVVAYESGATNLVAGQVDTNANLDVFAFNRTTGVNTLVSRASGTVATTAGDFSDRAAVSGDGSSVAFRSFAANLVAGQTDLPGTEDIFATKLATGVTVLVSRAAGTTVTAANGGSDFDTRQSVISSDGNVVVYYSAATNLVTGQVDANAGLDVFAFNVTNAANTLVSRSSANGTTTGNGLASNGTVSADGRTVAYQSEATNVVTGVTDTNTKPDIYLFGVLDGTTRLGSSTAADPLVAGNAESFFPSISESGAIVTFVSKANNLVTGVTSTTAQTYVTAGAVPPAAKTFLTGQGSGGASSVTVRDTTGAAVGAAINPIPGFNGGIRVATGDVNGDGTADFIFGAGPGGTSRIVVLDGKTRAEIVSFTAFEATFSGGVFVASADFNLDGYSELIVSADKGGGPRVLIFDGAKLAKGDFTNPVSFFGITDDAFRGGARVSAGDIDADGIADLTVAAGDQGGPRVTIWGGSNVLLNSRTKMFDIYIFEDTLRNGAFISSGDVDGDGNSDLVLGGGPTGAPRVRIVSGRQLISKGAAQSQSASIELASFFTGDSANRGGVTVTVKDLDGDSKADVVAGSGTGASPRVFGYLGKNIAVGAQPPAAIDLLAADASFTGGVFVG